MTRLFSRYLFLLALLLALATEVRGQPPREVGTWKASGNKGAVVAGGQGAVDAGLTILKRGGNAADAAVATLLALSVTDSGSFCFGGEVPIMVYDARRKVVEVLAGQGVAPRLATRAHFAARKGGIPGKGIEPAAVPAALDACLTALDRYGTRTFAEVAAPTLALLDRKAKPWHADLAHTLRRLIEVEKGSGGDRRRGLRLVADYFYRGPIAREIDAWSRANGGLLRFSDLATHVTRVEEPVSVDYRGHVVYKCGPWTQGPYLLETLRLLEGFDLKGMGHNKPDTIHVTAEAMKLALADRDVYYADPLFVQVPLNELLSKKYADLRRPLIDRNKASLEQRPGDPRGGKALLDRAEARKGLGGPVNDTTTCLVADAQGNVVAATPSGWSGVLAGRTGVWLGSRLQSFNTWEGHPNCIELGKRPRITLTPTLVLKDGKPVLAISVAGGDGQDQASLQVLLNVLDFGMPPAEAVTAPRFGTDHLLGSFRQKPPKLGSLLIYRQVGEETIKDLEKRGHKVTVRKPPLWAPTALTIDPRTGMIHAAGDPRARRHAGAVASASTTTKPTEAPQRPRRPRPWSGVYKARIVPHWFENNKRFWYRNDNRGGPREFIVVDAEGGKRQPAFDHQKLAAALSKAAAKEYRAERLPFDSIEFEAESKAIRFKVDDTTWKCDLTTYQVSPSEKSTSLPADEQPAEEEALTGAESPWPNGLAPDAEQRTQPVALQRPSGRSARSLDGKWSAFIKEGNVFVRAADGKETQLSKDGKEGLAYGMLSWSGDSKTLVAFRIEPGERKEVHLIESSPRDGGRARLHSRPYALPGDKFTTYELNLFDVTTGKQTKPAVDRIDFGTPRLRWHRDGRRFTYQKVDRGHQRFRVIEIETPSGNARILIDEQTKTFIWTAHGLGTYARWLDQTEEIIFASERDGWRHLYLIDAKAGKLKNQITSGEWVVRGIDRIEKARQVWFRASGRNAGQDPYLIHHYRINFDGSGLVALTEGNGTHTVQYSPDRKYLIDTYSRVDLAPVHELRRVADGKLVCPLEKADIAELEERGWRPPEVFSATGRDGKTSIWGIIARPRKLDPNKKYPVIEYIYAGPHDSHVPKGFSPFSRFRTLTDLGFIVVQIDGMGTANRSKAFHDVCWHNLKDAGFPDRILWHKAVAQKYPYYDITRVGIYGTSAGGQNAAGALLFHGDFYKAAVSACGCHDNRMDKASWNEQWMGYPVGPHYAECSNITHAHKLRGKLLLIVGEMDTNVPPESTLRLVDALVKAGKDFDLLVVPGMGHSNGGAYGQRRLQDFFVRHLQGTDPPDRNAGPQKELPRRRASPVPPRPSKAQLCSP
jgi:gamma-glutamyltranspeptidase